MPKQEHKILEFHGGTNNKFDPRDIEKNQNVLSQFSINKPGKLTLEGAALTLYDKTDINGATITTGIASDIGGFSKGYGLFAFSHDYSMESPDIVQNGDDVNVGDAEWSRKDIAGSADGWTTAIPAVYENDSTASLINVLGGDAIDAGEEYILTFEILSHALSLIIGGGDLSGNVADEIFVEKSTYAVGVHSVTFKASADRTHLWFTATEESAGGGKINNVSCRKTPSEVDTEFVVINDANGIDIYDPNQSADEWQNDKFTLGSRVAKVKPEYYNVDGALRVCDSNFGVTQADTSGADAVTITSDIIQDGDDTSETTWTYRDAAGNVDGWTDANPSVFENNETASIINTLASPYLQANVAYNLTFEVAAYTLNLAIGGHNQNSGGSADETFIAAANYVIGTHTVTFTPTEFKTYLWITGTEDSEGAGTIDNVVLKKVNAISKNDVSIGLGDGSGSNIALTTGDILQIDQEIMFLTEGATSTSFTVIRGYANSVISTHKEGVPVYFANIPRYFGHIKKDRLFEAESSSSVNTWVLDAQSPQPPNNTRTGATASPHLASSSTQSLRIYDIIEGSTINYPEQSEKVVLEFSEGSGDVGIIKVEHLGGTTLKLTTSGYGSSSTAGHKLKEGEQIVIDGVQTAYGTDLSNLAGQFEILSTPSATTFTIQDDNFSSGMAEDATPGGDEAYSATVDAWTDIGGSSGDFPDFIKVSVDEDNDLPGLVSAIDANTLFYIHITGQTGVNAFNGIHQAYKVDTDDLRFKTNKHEQASDVAGTTEIQQLLGVVRPSDSGAINADLKRKWNFAMSFTYDGPGLEMQESLLTHGYKVIPATQTDGLTSNLINF